MNPDNSTFHDASHPEQRELIRDYLTKSHLFGVGQCDMNQWHWLREGTPDHTLDQTIQLINNGAFLVGIEEHFDESLVLWRHFMGLFVEDILYLKLRAGAQHPSLSDWLPKHQAIAKSIAERCGENRYFASVQQQFEVQVAAYGGWTKLRLATEEFHDVNSQVNALCEHVPLTTVSPGVQARTVCLVAMYRKHELAKIFGEA